MKERNMDLVKEGRIIQERIRSSCQQVSKDYAKTFANLMMQGRVSSALKTLTSHPGVCLLKINYNVVIALLQKHSKPSPMVLVMKPYLVILITLMKKWYRKHHL